MGEAGMVKRRLDALAGFPVLEVDDLVLEC
jgi:hypothetical protein